VNRIRWTKQQDFCLRLGLLKALVAVLPAHGRSVDRQVILRDLSQALFRKARTINGLETSAVRVLGEAPREPLTIADALLVAANAGSWGQPIDEKKVSKILEWGHGAGLVGRGNQMSERAILLRSLFPAATVSKFVAGASAEWNPFLITPIERAFFFYHLGEADELLWTVARRAAVGREPGTVIGASDARKITVHESAAMLQRVVKTAPVNEMTRLRQLRELVARMEAEVKGEMAPQRHGPPKPRKRGAAAKSQRATTKIGDHETIPRFEILVDLGFFKKGVPPDVKGEALWSAMNAWSFMLTPAAVGFAGVAPPVDELGWQWSSFARAMAASRLLSSATRRASIREAFAVFMECYDVVKRRAGHTPFESVAFLAMLRGLERGVLLEVAQLHAVLLALRRNGELADHVYFAAGNEIDKMFILIRPGFLDALDEWTKTRGDDLTTFTTA
jgi:hypothetical protein